MMKAEKGFFGDFGGSFVPAELQSALNKIENAFETCKEDPAFVQEYKNVLKEYVGRENPLTFAERLTKIYGGPKIYLKREDLNHTGAHKINNVVGQILLARHMGAHRIIAETGAGQHGVATATACAMFGMDCTIYMGKLDTERQALNVFRMELLGAKVVPVSQGQGRLKDAVDVALGDLVENYENTFYLLGSAVGPHPYPSIVKYFQSIISEESKRQILEKEGQLPAAVFAVTGGGSNAIGSFAHYIKEDGVRLIGAEPEEAATMSRGKAAELHGFKTLVLQDKEGKPAPTYSIAAGLDYPGIGPEHSYLKESGRAEYYTVSKKQVMDAFKELSSSEGIIPALESAHAVALVKKMSQAFTPDESVIVTISGRGDKDVAHVHDLLQNDAAFK